MKIAYAFRRGTFYPFVAGQGWALPGGETRMRYLRQVKDIGFDGIELGLDSFGGTEANNGEAVEFAKGLADAGVPCVAIRAGGGLCQPNVADRNRRRLEKAIEVAGAIGAEIVNTALSTPPRNRTMGSTQVPRVGRLQSGVNAALCRVRMASYRMNFGNDADIRTLALGGQRSAHTRQARANDQYIVLIRGHILLLRRIST